MFLRRKPRIAVVMLAVLSALVFCTDSHADYWLGYRTNGKLCNRYMLTLDTPDPYKSAYQSAVDTWREQGPSSISQNLYIFTPSVGSPIPAEMDKLYIGTHSRRGLNGFTIPYRLSGNRLFPVKEGDAVGFSKTWRRCVVYIYTNQILISKRIFERKTNDTSYTVEDWVNNTALHEIGHTLKLAHPGDGADSKARRDPGANAVLVKERKADSAPFATIQSYDLSELNRKVIDTR